MKTELDAHAKLIRFFGSAIHNQIMSDGNQARYSWSNSLLSRAKSRIELDQLLTQQR